MHFVIFHPYDTPTFKTKVLCLVGNEGQVKQRLQLYERVIQPYLSLLWLQLVTHFVIFYVYETLTLMLHLVSNEGRVKFILQLYKRLIQPYLSLL